MNTIVKPNDIINQILTIAAELTPVAEVLGHAEPWAKMLATRDWQFAQRAGYRIDDALIDNLPEGPRRCLKHVAHTLTLALYPGRTCLQLHYDLQEVQDARAALEPLLAELRGVPA
jgi:hypothetical protein